MEGKPTKNPGSKIEEEAFVKDEWFDAYFRGNALIPQTGEGIVLSLQIGTVLENENTNWEQFFNSRFSPEQITRLGDAMSAMHKRKGIDVGTEKNVQTFINPPRIIPEETLQALWRQANSLLMVTLDSYIRGRQADRKFGIEIIKNFFDDPSNKIKINELRKALIAIKDGLNDPTVRELLAQYRDEFKSPEKRKLPPNYIWGNTYRKKFERKMFEKLTKAWKGVFPKNLEYLFQSGDDRDYN